ncbi:MAG: hypothetical protein EAY75_18120 [Bacteroidetes bacterium]|nr:MAG: hypothetical protein EAY75_18120 [Bacteroidota bacterium]
MLTNYAAQGQQLVWGVLPWRPMDINVGYQLTAGASGHIRSLLATCPAVLPWLKGPGWQRKSFFWRFWNWHIGTVARQKKIGAYSPMLRFGFALRPMAPQKKLMC